MSQRDQVEVNKTSQILPQALWQCWIWWGDLLAVYIGITFFVSRTLRLGIRVFAAQSHWKFTLRWINKVLIGFIGCSIHSTALLLASIQLIPDQWGDWLLYRHLGKALFSCFVFSPPPTVITESNSSLGCVAIFQQAFAKSLIVIHGRLMFRNLFLMSEQKTLAVWMYTQYDRVWLWLFMNWLWVCCCKYSVFKACGGLVCRRRHGKWLAYWWKTQLKTFNQFNIFI